MSGWSSGIVGAEERDQLIREGEYLFDMVREEHYGFCHHKSITYPQGKKSIPWTYEQEICIALALFARKKGIQEGANNT